jgi:hypothetical protein
LSHTCGTVVTLPAPLHLGPDTGEAQTAPNTWAKSLAHVPAPGGTKFAIVHFMNVTLPGANRLEVDLGYGTDTFTAADGGQFWTRPINVDAVGGGTHLTMRYITGGGGAGGGAFVDRYGRGESLPSHAAGHDSITNCDHFLPSGWTGDDGPQVRPVLDLRQGVAPGVGERPLRRSRRRAAPGGAQRRDDRDHPRADAGPSPGVDLDVFGDLDRRRPRPPGGALHLGSPLRAADQLGDLRLRGGVRRQRPAGLRGRLLQGHQAGEVPLQRRARLRHRAAAGFAAPARRPGAQHHARRGRGRRGRLLDGPVGVVDAEDGLGLGRRHQLGQHDQRQTSTSPAAARDRACSTWPAG